MNDKEVKALREAFKRLVESQNSLIGLYTASEDPETQAIALAFIVSLEVGIQELWSKCKEHSPVTSNSELLKQYENNRKIFFSEPIKSAVHDVASLQNCEWTPSDQNFDGDSQILKA